MSVDTETGVSGFIHRHRKVILIVLVVILIYLVYLFCWAETNRVSNGHSALKRLDRGY